MTHPCPNLTATEYDALVISAEKPDHARPTSMDALRARRRAIDDGRMICVPRDEAFTSEPEPEPEPEDDQDDDDVPGPGDPTSNPPRASRNPPWPDLFG